jgi:hypothetical protein
MLVYHQQQTTGVILIRLYSMVLIYPVFLQMTDDQ